MNRYCIYCKKTFKDGQDAEFFRHKPACAQMSREAREAEKKQHEKKEREKAALLKEYDDGEITVSDVLAAKEILSKDKISKAIDKKEKPAKENKSSVKDK